MTASVTFSGVMGGKNNKARIIVPADAVADLGAGDEPEVDVEVNGYRYRSQVRFQHGVHFVSHTVPQRKESGIVIGDAITVTMTAAS